MSTLLFEIGCEQLPASACYEAERQLPDLVRRHVGPAGELRLFVGPRRVAFALEGVPAREADRVEQKRGPSEDIAFEKDGRPTRAAEGFARAHGLPVEELERRDGFVWAATRITGRPLAEVLPEALTEIVRGLAFSKSMRWNGGALRFARPIRWLCAMLDERVIELDLEGIPSGGVSYGHRFTAGKTEIVHAAEYDERLRDAGVEPDALVRRAEILRALDDIGDWRDPRSVLDEVVHLIERPLVLTGSYDERFLELPLPVIETVMQSHQRYFPLGPGRFAFVANGGDEELVRSGNENVLEARLDDAMFSYERDRELGIERMAERLPSITFHARAGTFADKALRLERLCDLLGGGEASRQAARLAKADQASAMVHEFPELEGFIGSVYARLADAPEAVAAAIAEQYLPETAGGALPQTVAGRVLAAADKLDNLTVAFALGERPTGSRDPYALRRAAIGLCRLAIEAGLEIEVRALVERDVALLVSQGADLTDDPSDVWDFVVERLEGVLDIPVEFVRAARAAPLSELGALARLAETLAAEADSEACERACVAYERASRLASRADGAAAALDARLASDDAEVALVEALADAGARIEGAVAERDFRAALAAAADLAPAVDRFFDEVLVMSEDPLVRGNRLRLLLDVRDAVGLLGDLSQIPR